MRLAAVIPVPTEAVTHKEVPDMSESFQKVLEALREKGLVIPDEVTDATGLVIAIKAQGSRHGSRPAPPPPGPDQDLDDVRRANGDGDDDEPAYMDGMPALMNDGRSPGRNRFSKN
jgi:hypothetical protein